MPNFRRILAAFPTLLLLSLPLRAESWAVGGYDPVAYLTQNRAVAGRADLATTWQGKQYHFATPESRAAFESNPRAYTPGLDGLCVVAMSEGRVEPGDPRQFVTIGERFYFAANAERRRALAEQPQKYLMRAKELWLELQRK